jgi:hypothetical protein
LWSVSPILTNKAPRLIETIGTYYWYMYLVDLNTLPLYDEERTRSNSLKSASCSDGAGTKRPDIETSAAGFDDQNRHMKE